MDQSSQKFCVCLHFDQGRGSVINVIIVFEILRIIINKNYFNHFTVEYYSLSSTAQPSTADPCTFTPLKLEWDTDITKYRNRTNN